MRTLIALLAFFSLTATAWCQTTQPTQTDPDEMLKQLLTPVRNTPILPEPDERTKTDQASLKTVAPRGEAQNLIREGTYILDRIGRLARTPDGQPEFAFEIDGQAMKDPPVLILPNTKLMIMEDMVKRMGRSPKFRITALVTEYGSRNYILIQHVTVPSDGPIPPQPRKGDDRK